MKQSQFLNVLEKDEALRRFREALPATRGLQTERIALVQALGRVLGEDVISSVDVPGFDRSNMDGWALRAADTYGASEQHPLRLNVAETAVAIGVLPDESVEPGQAMAIPTGGPLPRGADAVLQVEATELYPMDGEVDGKKLVEIRRAITPGTALTHAGTDIARGEVVLRAGELLTSRETGVLAAIGLDEVRVRVRARVAILSTGDELVAPGSDRPAGKVFDSNATILADAVRECGCEPVSLGIAPDDEGVLHALLRRAIAEHDVVLLSGGTSKGPGDLNAQVLGEVVEPPGIVVHGVALKPGKPLCLAVSGDTPVVILPGFPTSAIFTFHEFVAPLLREISGREQSARSAVDAVLPFRFRSDPGRTEYCLVHLVRDEHDQRLAYPIGKGSGSVTTWSHADGYFVVPRHTEQVDAGATVTVHAMAGQEPRQNDLVVIGSHCVGLDWLLGIMRERGFSTKLVAVGSEAGLAAAQRGACDLAGVHLLHAESGIYNEPFVSAAVELVRGYGRLQGVVYRAGDPRFEGKDARVAVSEAAASDGIAMINRNRGSGTRALYDMLLGEIRPPGHSIEASSHHAVAAAVAQGRADFGIAINVVAHDRGLGFLPLTHERYDFVIPKGRRARPAVEAFVALLSEPETRAQLAERGFEP